MSRVPKPPLGFVPVDSEEARGICAYQVVNMARVIDGRWETGATFMRDVRDLLVKYPERHYHVQLPPAVEWEEVWGWRVSNMNKSIAVITKNGKHHSTELWRTQFTDEQLNTIVRALNEMEGRDGR